MCMCVAPLVGGVLPLCISAVGVFYSPSRQGSILGLNNLLISTLKEAANQLCNNLYITICTGGKTNIFIILKQTTTTKFKISSTAKQNFKNSPKISPTNLKHIIKIITANNTEIGFIKLTKITGDYKPRYIYGIIKTH